MIEIANVTMEFRNKGVGGDGSTLTALKDISVMIPDGCVYGFLGSNGAGKSTLMRLLCGVYRLQKGTIKVDGRDVWNNASVKSEMFFVNDETVQYADFTLEGLRKYYRSYYETFSDEVFYRLAKQLQLPLNRKMSSFSKGMKRQAVVIVGLASMTKYLVLDEAFDGLDPAMRKMVKDIITDEMLDRGATLILSSHNIAEINELCDRALLIHKGELVFDGEIDKIRSCACKVQLMRKDSTITREELEKTGVDILKYSIMGSVAQVIVRGAGDEIMQKISAVPNDVCELIPLTLEEVFIYELEARGYGHEALSEN